MLRFTFFTIAHFDSPSARLKSYVSHLQPNMTGSELDQLRAVLLCHCDVNKDGKIQKNELALCLGVKP